MWRLQIIALHFVFWNFHIQISLASIGRQRIRLHPMDMILFLCQCPERAFVCTHAYTSMWVHRGVNANPLGVVLDSWVRVSALRHFVHTFAHVTRHLSNICWQSTGSLPPLLLCPSLCLPFTSTTLFFFLFFLVHKHRHLRWLHAAPCVRFGACTHVAPRRGR